MAQHEQQELGPSTLDKFHEVEMVKLFDAIEGALNREQQMAALFGTASIAVLSIGFSTQKAGLLFLAGVVLWLFLGYNLRNRKYIATYYYRGLQLQARFAPNDNGFYLNILPSPLTSWIHEIANLPQGAPQIKALHSIPLRVQSVAGFWIPLVASLVDISVGLIMWIVFRWPIF